MDLYTATEVLGSDYSYRAGLTCNLSDWMPGRCPCNSGTFRGTFWTHVQCQGERVTSL